MKNKDPYEKEKQQLDETLNLVREKLRKQSAEYSKFKIERKKYPLFLSKVTIQKQYKPFTTSKQYALNSIQWCGLNKTAHCNE